MSRRNRGRVEDMWDDPLRAGESLSQADSEIFGESDETRYLRAKPIDIDTIAPDPMQPRRVIPQSVAAAFDAQLTSVGVDDVLSLWHQAASDLVALPPVAQMLEGGTELDVPHRLPPLVGNYLELVRLALSIRDQGLANPITIFNNSAYAPEVHYLIETGERRWFAYHLLRSCFPAENQWHKIPARVVASFDVWRQAAENNARANLNAIARVRQYALLLMDLVGVEHFQPMTAFEHEKDFYAQVLEYRVPYGAGGKLLAALGIESRSLLSNYNQILTLERHEWTQADEENWSLQRLLSISNNSPRQKRTKPPTLLTDPAIRRGKRFLSKGEEQLIRQKTAELAAIRDGVGEALPGTKIQIAAIISDLRRFLDSVERIIESD